MSRAFCPSCRERLTAGRCPGTRPLIRVGGRRYGIAAQIAHALGRDITVAMVYRWRNRDGLATIHVSRTAYSPLDHAATIERDKRLSGTGRPRVA